MRFLLGVAEAGFFPGVLYYLTLWFPASYRGHAISRFYVAFPLSAAVMGALAGPLLSLDGQLGLAGWQWLFLIEGAPAVLLGGVILACLPDNPSEARWLTETERTWIQNRLCSERGAPGVSVDQGFARALLDRRVWLLGLCNVCIFGASYGFGLSAPTVLKSVTHWSAAQVGAFVSVTALLGALCLVFNGAHSDRRGERYLHAVLPLSVVAGAFLAMGLAARPEVVVPAYILYYACYAATQGAFWLIPSDTLHGRGAAAGLAAVGSIGMLGAFMGPFAWGLAKDHTGSYQLGLLCLSFSFMTAALLLLLIRRTTRSAATSTAEVVA
jgi:ACS family tartrate transporter-like MFS transporter